MAWTYDPRTHNYRQDGRFVAFSEIRDVALQMAVNSGNTVLAIARQLIDGQLKLEHWQEFMRLAIKNEHLAQYMAGRGGKAQMTFRDYGIVGNILKEQYRFLDGFAHDIATGNMTPAQIMARARLYIASAHQSFWRGRTEALGMPRLPTYPAEGDTNCLVNCRCQWGIQELRSPDGGLLGWNATWVLDPKAAEVHCEDCPRLADVWHPLWVPAGMTAAIAEAWRLTEREKVKGIIGLSAFDHNHIDLGGQRLDNLGIRHTG